MLRKIRVISLQQLPQVAAGEIHPAPHALRLSGLQPPDPKVGVDAAAHAVSAIIVSNFRNGYEQLAAVQAKYGKEPWFKYVHGDIAFCRF